MKLIYSTLFLLIFFSSHIFAQDTTFFNKDWKEIDNKSNAAYYRITKKEGKKWKVNDYYINGKLQMSGYFTSLKDEKKDGLFSYFYENGKQEKVVFFKNENEFMVQRWNDDGKEFLKNGTGNYIYYNEQVKNEITMYYKDSLFQHSYYIDTETKEQIYLALNNNEATPINGFKNFYQEYAQAIVYPKEARRNGIEGRVFISFIVRKNGNVDNIKVLKGIGYGCDEQVLKFLKTYKGWKAGNIDGNNINQMFIMPFAFKLND